MDTDLIDVKIERLMRCVSRIESKTPSDASSLSLDLDAQDIIVVNLERAVQQCVDIGMHLISAMKDIAPPASMGEMFTLLNNNGVLDDALALRMKKAVGFRNTAVHAYQQIDYDIVFSIVTKNMDDFRKFAKQVVEYRQAGGPASK